MTTTQLTLPDGRVIDLDRLQAVAEKATPGPLVAVQREDAEDAGGEWVVRW